MSAVVDFIAALVGLKSSRPRDKIELPRIQEIPSGIHSNSAGCCPNNSSQLFHHSDFSKMLAEEGSPSLTLRTIPSFAHIFGDGRLSDVESEFYQFSMDPVRASGWIFVIYVLDKHT
jgi:hypothetical protein